MKPRLLIALLCHAALWAAAPGSDAVPVFFVANHGQAPPDVRFTAQGSGIHAFFSTAEVRYQVPGASLYMQFDGAYMQFDGAQREVRMEGAEPLPGHANFLLGGAESWHAGIPLYGAVVYRDLYPGIDMRYGAHGRNLKSEFTVAPGADPARIRVRYVGADAVKLAEDGSLEITLHGQVLTEQPPEIYQQVDGRRVWVPGSFTVADATVGFIVSGYDASQPLIIDPVLSYSTLVGGSNSDAAMSLAVDASGAAYVAGFTASRDFPTANPAQNFNAGSNDIFVAKLNAAGNGLVYCTYLGGSGDDRAYGIAVDASGAAWVTGSTASGNFPVRLALQSKLAGGRNAFVLKLNAAGNALLFSTYLGGNASDTANGIALDGGGNAYVTGDTTSVNFPTTGLQTSKRPGQDAFVTGISADGSRLLYSTYLGGSSDDHGAAIAVDAGGSAYVTGSTYSSDFPVANAWQAHLAGGQDAFVARLAAGGGAWLFSSYLGGAGGSIGYPESGQAIALDSVGNAYVTGSASSADFPVLHPVQPERGGWMDAFAAKWSGGGALLYSTYLGGSGVDSGNGIAVDALGAAYLVGQTFSSDLPTINSWQSATGGSYDAFVAKLGPAGDSLELLSYLGGNSSDTATAVALDSAGNLYAAGWTLSTNFPVVNAYQTANAGNYGAFLAKIAMGAPPAAVSVTPASGSGATQTFQMQFSDPAGAANLATASVLFQSSVTLSNGCAVIYTALGNTLALLTDAGAAPAGTITPGSGTQQNSQCVLNGAASAVSRAGNVLTLSLAITFQPAFAGARNIYLQAANSSGTSGWQQRGAWTVPATGPPVPVSVTPGSGSGSSQAFTFSYSDPKGYSAIASSLILINSTMLRSGACYLLYYRSTNTIYLTNDAGTAWQTPLALGQSGSLQNSQCSVNAAGSSSSGSGNNLAVNLALSFQNVFAGAKNIYMEVYDGSADSGWQQRGTWTVPATGPPVPVSVTPGSGSGRTQTFSFSYMDPKGYTAIVSSLILINNPMKSSGGCYLLYYRSTNAIYLTNDAGTAWQTPLTLGQSGPLQNSQCSVNAVASSSNGSGTNLTVNLSLTFQAAFAGLRNIYMEVNDGAADSGWQQRGTWTVP